MTMSLVHYFLTCIRYTIFTMSNIYFQSEHQLWIAKSHVIIFIIVQYLKWDIYAFRKQICICYRVYQAAAKQFMWFIENNYCYYENDIIENKRRKFVVLISRRWKRKCRVCRCVWRNHPATLEHFTKMKQLTI